MPKERTLNLGSGVGTRGGFLSGSLEESLEQLLEVSLVRRMSKGMESDILLGKAHSY